MKLIGKILGLVRLVFRILEEKLTGFLKEFRNTDERWLPQEKQLVLDLKVTFLEWSHFSRGVLANFAFRREREESISGRRAYILGIIFFVDLTNSFF